MCELSDESTIAAPNQQVVKQSCGVSVWQNKCTPCTYSLERILNYHVETYDYPYFEPDPQP